MNLNGQAAPPQNQQQNQAPPADNPQVQQGQPVPLTYPNLGQFGQDVAQTQQQGLPSLPNTPVAPDAGPPPQQAQSPLQGQPPQQGQPQQTAPPQGQPQQASPQQVSQQQGQPEGQQPQQPSPGQPEQAQPQQQGQDIGQRERQLAQQQQQLQVQQFLGQVDTEAESYRQNLVAQGWEPFYAQEQANLWKQSQHNELRTTLRAQAAIDQGDARQQAAAQISERTGMPVNDLIQYGDPQSMELAARQWQNTQSQIAQLQEQMNRMQAQFANVAAPPQQFQNGGAQGLPSASSIEDLYGTNEDIPLTREYDNFMNSNGFI